jgi:hypothetical protein
MLYAMLAYHVEGVITAMTPDEDVQLMEGMHKVHGRLTEEGKLGPAARLGPTDKAVTVRGGAMIDGPFAETKEALRDTGGGRPGGEGPAEGQPVRCLRIATNSALPAREGGSGNRVGRLKPSEPGIASEKRFPIYVRLEPDRSIFPAFDGSDHRLRKKQVGACQEAVRGAIRCP